MPAFLRHLIGSTLLLAASLCAATSHQFSYRASNGATASGSFEGVVAGDYVTGITNLWLSIQGGTARPAALRSFWVEGGGQGEAFSVSANNALNNFWFVDPAALDANGNLVSEGDYGLALIGNVNTPLSIVNGKNLDFVRDEGLNLSFAPLNASWLLVAVPEPANVLLMGAGLLGLVGVLRGRQRKAAATA